MGPEVGSIVPVLANCALAGAAATRATAPAATAATPTTAERILFMAGD
jgi:hypothetical protein